jgi:hypothetical protein
LLGLSPRGSLGASFTESLTGRASSWAGFEGSLEGFEKPLDALDGFEKAWDALDGLENPLDVFAKPLDGFEESLDPLG